MGQRKVDLNNAVSRHIASVASSAIRPVNAATSNERSAPFRCVSSRCRSRTDDSDASTTPIR